MIRKILVISSILFLGLLVNPRKILAMMPWASFSSNIESEKTLTDEEYQELGEEWMEKMMGEQHENTDKQMAEAMGEDFVRQMHIAMGKRMQNPGGFGVMPMMGMLSPWQSFTRTGGGVGKMMGYSGMMGRWGGSPFWDGFYSFLGVITWLALIAFLITGVIFFLKKSKDSDKK